MEEWIWQVLVGRCLMDWFTEGFRSIFGRFLDQNGLQNRPETVPKPFQMGPETVPDGGFLPEIIRCGPKFRQHRSKVAPSRLKMAQDGSKMANQSPN